MSLGGSLCLRVILFGNSWHLPDMHAMMEKSLMAKDRGGRAVKTEKSFYQRAAVAARHIPYGKVATYGQLALLCGKPKNARQVGYGLNKGLLGEDVPAHRVVNARGVLSGAAAFETFDMQKLLLEGEGVEVAWTAEGWRVDLARYGWKNTLAEAQRLREEYRIRGI